MSKRKRKKGQSLIFKTLHRKQKIELNKHRNGTQFMLQWDYPSCSHLALKTSLPVTLITIYL